MSTEMSPGDIFLQIASCFTSSRRLPSAVGRKHTSAAHKIWRQLTCEWKGPKLDRRLPLAFQLTSNKLSFRRDISLSISLTTNWMLSSNSLFQGASSGGGSPQLLWQSNYDGTTPLDSSNWVVDTFIPEEFSSRGLQEKCESVIHFVERLLGDRMWEQGY